MFGYRLVKEEELRQLREEGHHHHMEAQYFASLRDQALGETRQAEARALESATRAASAEAMVHLQAKSIERLMASNERMVKLVSDMRRSGFGILEPIETKEQPETVADNDRDLVASHPELAADPE